jgi:hypothetical protein
MAVPGPDEKSEPSATLVSNPASENPQNPPINCNCHNGSWMGK